MLARIWEDWKYDGFLHVSSRKGIEVDAVGIIFRQNKL